MTALFDAQSFALLDGLRHRYFPAALNRVPAHATLFHHLPGEEHRAILERLATLRGSLAPMAFSVSETLFLGRGVGLRLHCPGLVALRAELAAAWRDRLTAQDRQGYRPHVTIQNKVSVDTARATAAEVAALLPLAGSIGGLRLWHYRGGPWEEAGTIRFGP